MIELRVQALEMAVEALGGHATPAEIVAAAEAFYKFLSS